MQAQTIDDGGPLLIQIDNIFTPEQCKALIEAAENSGGFRLEDRGNAQYERVMMVRPDLARVLFQGLRHLIPDEVDGNRVTGLNDHFRFSKYHPGMEFKIHRDGINQDSTGARSALTLNIFLNDDFEGGSTDFFNTWNEDDLRFSVQPRPGRGALFFAQQYHCGQRVVSGNKYLLRTDVMVSDIYNVGR
jgi:prolyl 4-hydroxylase